MQQIPENSVWFVAYGAQLSHSYLTSTTGINPIYSSSGVFPGSLYFSPTEQGRVEAFYDPDGDDIVLGRLWLITKDELALIYQSINPVAQNGLTNGWQTDAVDISPYLRGKQKAFAIPAYAFTALPRRRTERVPDRNYLDHMAIGLREAHNLSVEQITRYLRRQLGLIERIPITV